MKKIKFLLVIGLVAVLSGCKFEYNMKIDKSKKVDFDVVVALPDTILNGIDNLISEENNEEVEESNEEVTTIGEESNNDILSDTGLNCDEMKESLDGWKVDVYDDGTYKGCRLQKTFASIDDISSDEEVTVPLYGIFNGEFNNSKLFTKKNDEYSAHYTFDLDTLKDESGQEMDSITKVMSLASLKYTVELPYKNLSNNANTVENDGKKLIWTLDGTKSNDIKFSFKFKEKCNFPWIYVGIGAGALLIIIILCVVLTKGKKCDCSNCNCTKEEATEEPKEVSEEPIVEEIKEEVTDEVKEEVSEEPIIEEIKEEVTDEVKEVSEEPKDNN